jgi:hypothetical protein
MNMGITTFGLLFIQQEWQEEYIGPPTSELDFFYFFWLIAYSILFLYSIIRLLDKSRRLDEYEKMKCPNCKKEPYSLFKWSAKISIWNFLKGQRRCIHCNSLIKIHYSNWFWGSALVFSTVYLLYMIPFLFGLTFYADASIVYIFIGIGLVGFIAGLIMVITTAFTTRYELLKE